MKIILLAVIDAVLIFGSACGTSQSLDDIEPTQTDTVAVRDNKFEPRVIEVRVGTTVTWNWRGNTVHDVTAEDWKSELKEAGSYEHRFETIGTEDYRCAVHPGMAGRVIITE